MTEIVLRPNGLRIRVKLTYTITPADVPGHDKTWIRSFRQKLFLHFEWIGRELKLWVKGDIEKSRIPLFRHFQKARIRFHLTVPLGAGHRVCLANKNGWEVSQAYLPPQKRSIAVTLIIHASFKPPPPPLREASGVVGVLEDLNANPNVLSACLVGDLQRKDRFCVYRTQAT